LSLYAAHEKKVIPHLNKLYKHTWNLLPHANWEAGIYFLEKIVTTEKKERKRKKLSKLKRF
jgi:hypothetical protein